MTMDRLEDRAAITDQMFRYARATDWLETDRHREVFVDDCVFASPHSGDVVGVDAVVDWMNSALAQFEATQHLIGNIWIEFTGANSATAVSYVRAWHRYRDHDRPDMVLWGEYHDRWVARGRTLADQGTPRAGGRDRASPGRRSPEPAEGEGMKVGLVYPQVELRGDPQAVHDIGVGAEQLGFDHLLVYDHVVGAEHDDREPPLWGPYTERDPFHEPLVMFGYLAAVTSPDRAGDRRDDPAPTPDGARRPAGCRRRPVVARERVRLGVGTGLELRRVRHVGPGLRHPGPSPGRADRAAAPPVVAAAGHVPGPLRSRRASLHQPATRDGRSRSGSGASPSRRTGGAVGSATASPSPATSMPPWHGMSRVRHHIAEAGRSADGFGFELIATRARSATQVTETAERWRSAGGTHVSVLTIKLGLDTAAAHLDYASSAKDALDARIGARS